MTNFDDKQWYTEGNGNLLAQTVTTLEASLVSAREADAYALSTYYAASLVQIREASPLAVLTSAIAANAQMRTRFNLLKSAIDTFLAMALSVPAIDVTTTGGSSAQKRSAEALGWFCDGVFAANELVTTAWECGLDACLARVAAVKVEMGANLSPEITRIYPHRIVWNSREGRNPRNLFTRTAVARASVLARWPAMATKIKEAPQTKEDPLFDQVGGIYATDVPTELIDLYEGWRVKDGDDEGRYVAALANNVTLTEEEWPHTFHCIVPLRFSPSFNSFAGTPAADTLLAYQDALDRSTDVIDEAQTKGANSYWLNPTDSNVPAALFTNQQAKVIPHTPGSPPKFVGGLPILPPEFYQREKDLIERAYAFMGVSSNVAGGSQAKGIPSAKGQREVRDIASQRLILHMQTFDRWFESIARVAVGLADAAYEGKKGAVVKAPGTKLLRRVSWDEIDYDEDEFAITCNSVNALSRHPSARIEEILDLAAGGVIDQREALRQLRVKDLQSTQDAAFAAEDLADKMIDRALDGRFIAPEKYQGAQGLAYLVKRGGERYCQEMLEEEPSPNLTDLRKLIEQAQLLISQMSAAPPGPAPGPEAGAQPPGQAVMSGPPPGLAAPPPPGLPPALPVPIA